MLFLCSTIPQGQLGSLENDEESYIDTLCCAIVTRQIRKSLDGYFLSTPLDNVSGLDGGDDDDDDDRDY